MTEAEATALTRHAQSVADKVEARSKSAGNATSGPPKKLMVNLSRSARYGAVADHLLLVRVLERIRRAASYVFAIPAHRVKFASHFVSKITSARSPADSAVHGDESSFATFHLSGVLWLGTLGTDFGGGRVSFFQGNGPDPWVSVEPRLGRLALFTSGWENLHRVEPVDWGSRWSVPVFLETLPDPELELLELARNCIVPRSDKALDACLGHWPNWFDVDGERDGGGDDGGPI